MDSIVVAYMKEVIESKSEGIKVQRGSLKRIIDQKKIEFGVTRKTSTNTVLSRVKQGTIASVCVVVHHLH